ncbi:MAG: hypothetical protein ABJ053_11765 [Lentilitoribacter sp.]
MVILLTVVLLKRRFLTAFKLLPHIHCPAGGFTAEGKSRHTMFAD